MVRTEDMYDIRDSMYIFQTLKILSLIKDSDKLLEPFLKISVRLGALTTVVRTISYLVDDMLNNLISSHLRLRLHIDEHLLFAK